jgi:hypothetical protein
LADQIGTHQTNVSRWIRGDVPPLPMALKIEAVTRIGVAEWAEPAAAESATTLTVSAQHRTAS